MTSAEIIGRHKSICRKAAGMKIFDALYELQKTLENVTVDEFHNELLYCRETYFNVLKYTMKGVDDPKRMLVLNSLVIMLFELADKIKEYYLEKNNPALYTMKKKKNNSAEQLKNQFSGLIESKKVLQDKATIENKLFYKDLFEYIVYTDKLSDSDIIFINRISKELANEWYYLCNIVSALTISMLRYFDVSKMDMVFKYYKTGISQVSQRALVGMVLLFYVYDERVNLYKGLNDKINKIYAENEIPEQDLLSVIIQFLKAKDTERITRKMREEIIPDIQKLTPRIEDKLDLKNILSEDFSADKNPDWESILEDAPELLNKMEELSKMQLEGNDVFMSAFSMLKNFEFFGSISNWFLPFWKTNPDVDNMLQNEDNLSGNAFLDLLEKSTYMCNSDKYSFLLNLKLMPQQQKSMLLNMFNAELEGMDELAREDEMLNMSVKNNTIIIQYIQDIYRFFKLYHNKGDFEDIFLTKLDFYNKNFINAICREPKFILKIADFYFKTENYTEALEVFQLYLKTEKPDMDILQKAGYCMQRNKKYQEALEYYLKAELFGSGVPWLIKKIAYCYQCLRNYNKALEYYNEASRLEEDNPQVIMNIANCYLNLEDYKKALNYYYKIEFSFKENTGIYRPIAWCLFVLGDLKKSEEYFLKLIEYSLANPYDYMNYGHVLWAKGQREEASVYYLKSLDSMGNNFSRFTNSLNADSQHLIRYNIPKEEIQLMLDYLSFMLENN